MCTVTFVPKKDGFVFASNRDEQPLRQTLFPNYYKEEGVQLFYPKDVVAGGTWIGVSEQERLVCLLNGGKVYHNPSIKFPRSRGLVVKKILSTTNLQKTLSELDLEGVAPFTLIVIDWKEEYKIYELVWCRNQMWMQELNPKEKHIWSSTTLYTDEMKEARKAWFQNMEFSNPSTVVSRVLTFHQNASLGTVETAPKMKRALVETVSTTLIEKNTDVLALEYYDYVKNEKKRYQGLFDVLKV